MYYQAFVLFSTYLSIRGCRCSCNKVNITESEMLYSLVQVIATIKWTKLWISCLQLATKFISITAAAVWSLSTAS